MYGTFLNYWGVLFQNSVFSCLNFSETVLTNFILYKIWEQIYVLLAASPWQIVYKKWIFAENIFLVTFNQNLKAFPNPCYFIFKLFQNPAILLIHKFSKEPTELVYQQIIFVSWKQPINGLLRSVLKNIWTIRQGLIWKLLIFMGIRDRCRFQEKNNLSFSVNKMLEKFSSGGLT